jgi:squalene-hopene/tetraprenyl-beta-curcumene cyclase
VLLVHFLGETPNLELEQKIGRYLRRIQQADGGWPLFTDGAPNVSASVKAYFALKVIGDDENAEHMQRARRAIHAMGGAEMSNVFTRIQLALFGAIPWRAVPMMPVEIMLLPQWFPFHLSKVSYWARTVIVPLLVLNAKRPLAKNPRGVRIDELFIDPPVNAGLLPRQGHQSPGWFAFFRVVDHALRAADGLFPSYTRERAIRQAVSFVDERLNGEDGLGAIYPAMANAVMMYDVLGYPEDHPNRAIARKSIEAARRARRRSVLPAVPVAGVGHVARRACAARNRRRACGASCAARPRLAASAADPRRARRLDLAPSERAPRRLGVPVRERALPRRRRHGRGRDGDGSRAEAAEHGHVSRIDRARANGSSACRAATAAGARSSRKTRSTT